MDQADNSQAQQLWSNQTNNEFYENLTPEGLQAFAEKNAGLGDGCDLKILTPYWSQAKSILEVGAGYGRVIDYLLAHDFKGKITAVERCKNFFNFLKNKYSEDINLIKGDILKVDFKKEKFDVIFLLWSGIADFSPPEQALIFKIFANILFKNGKLIIDTLSVNVTPLGAKKCAKQTFLTIITDSSILTYEPNFKEIKKYGNLILKDANISHYITKTERKRCIYIIS